MGVFSSKRLPDGSYEPSPLVQTMFSSNFASKKFDATKLQRSGEKKGLILVVGSDKTRLPTQTGKDFSTGHNVCEYLVPLLYLESAGYEFDFATPSGGKLALEEWSWKGPKTNGYEQVLRDLVKRLQTKIDAPIDTKKALEKFDEYKAVFLPGGHGAMIEMHDPKDEGSLKSILEKAHAKELTTITLCHGPNALRACDTETYDGYEICCFPDKEDNGTSVTVGYLPGLLLEENQLQKQLKAKYPNIKFMNTNGDDSVHRYKELITGASPQASVNVGEMAVKVLAEKA